MSSPAADPALAVREALAASLAQIGLVLPYDRWTVEPSGAGWWPLRALVDDREHQDELIARIERRATPTGRELGPRYLASYLGQALVAAPTALMLRSGRVLSLHVDRIAVRPDEIGCLPEVALDPTVLTVLPDDPLAGTSGVEVAPDRAALRHLLVAELLVVLEPVVEALQTHQRPGRRNAWYLAVDGIGAACATLDDEDAARRAASAILDAARGTPLRTHRREFVRDPQTDELCWALNGCCRADQYPGHGHCALCPKRTLDDSLVQLAAH
jgi:hypothetical protein